MQTRGATFQDVEKKVEKTAKGSGTPTAKRVYVPKNTYAPTSNGNNAPVSYTSGNTASVSAAPASDGGYNAYMDLLNSWMEQQRAAAEAAAAAKRQAAQQAYDRGMQALGNAYSSMQGSLKSNYESGLGTLQDSYNSGVNGVNQQADKAQNQAYINYMLTKRDMPQLLAAQGVNGGAAESTMAGLANNYGSSRNNIDTGRKDSLSELLNQLNANKASALQSYNSSLSDLEQRKMAYQMQLEQALADQIASAVNTQYDSMQSISSDYLTQALALQKAQQEAAQAAAAKTYKASNTYTTGNTQQAGNSTLTNTINTVKKWLQNGYSDEDIASQLIARGYTNQEIQTLMQSAYGL